MKVLLINPLTLSNFATFKETCKHWGRKAICPSLGLLTVASLLPSDWECRLVDLNVKKLKPTDYQWADIVMLTGTIAQKVSIFKLLQEAKSYKKIVVIGGPYVSTSPEVVIEAGADFIFRGEAEDTFSIFLQDIEEGKKSGVYEAVSVPDITKSPMPRYELVNLNDYLYVSIQTSRGCPFKCEFCDVTRLYGHKMRYKEPEQIIRELDMLYDTGWRWKGDVFIVDDNFIGNPSKADVILDRMIPWVKEKGGSVGFKTQVSLNLAQNHQLIDKFLAANFSNVFIGIESPDEEILYNTNKLQNVKHPMVESINTITRAGLSVSTSFIFGFDNESPGVDKRICALSDQTHVPYVMLNIMKALPGTQLWQRLKQEGRLIEDDKTAWEFTFTVPNFVPTRPANDIVDEYRRTFNKLYNPVDYLKRAYKYCMEMPQISRTFLSNPTLKESFGIIKIVFRVLFHVGFIHSKRFLFWKYFFKLLKNKPSRAIDFIFWAETGVNMYSLVDAE